MSSVIRKIELEKDLERVVQIWLEANLQAHDFIEEDYFKSRLIFVEEAFKEAEIYVVEYEGKLVGFVGLCENFIEGIFIDSSYRSKGLGKLLLDYVKKLYGEIGLAVFEKNQGAYNFYLRNGFKLVERNMVDEVDEIEYVMGWKKSLD